MPVARCVIMCVTGVSYTDVSCLMSCLMLGIMAGNKKATARWECGASPALAFAYVPGTLTM